jgi:hypothetical protein
MASRKYIHQRKKLRLQEGCRSGSGLAQKGTRPKRLFQDLIRELGDLLACCSGNLGTESSIVTNKRKLSLIVIVLLIPLELILSKV